MYDLENLGSIPGRGGTCLLATTSRQAQEPSQPPTQLVPTALSARISRPEHEADQLLAPRAEFKRCLRTP